jgi:hypothetical protein
MSAVAYDSNHPELSTPDTKKGRMQTAFWALLLEHQSAGDVPTSNKFLFDELEQGSLVHKSEGRGGSVPGDAGELDVTDTSGLFRRLGLVPWPWIVDETQHAGHQLRIRVACRTLVMLQAMRVRLAGDGDDRKRPCRHPGHHEHGDHGELADHAQRGDGGSGGQRAAGPAGFCSQRIKRPVVARVPPAVAIATTISEMTGMRGAPCVCTQGS